MNSRPDRIALIALISSVLLTVSASTWAGEGKEQAGHDASGTTVLGATGSRFTLNGHPTFLLGMSYYGGTGAPRQSVEKDLDDLQRFGFNWLRVWATWGAFQHDVSAVDASGSAREPYLAQLVWLVSECDRRGMVVDVTLTRGPLSTGGNKTSGLHDFAAHRRAVETLVQALSTYHNWYLDLANEHDIRDDRYVSTSELKQLSSLVRQHDPTRLDTASFGGQDLSRADMREALAEIGADFLAIHRPREADSPRETESRTRKYLAAMQELDREVPVHYQEPFRRGYGNWQPALDDFLIDLHGARAGGAAGWCLHNGQQQKTEDNQPRRSFDLRERRLFDQLDDVELQVVRRAKEAFENDAE